MSYRLLVELEVIRFLDALKPAERKHLIAIFEKILQFPGNCVDYVEQGEDGRGYDVHVSLANMRFDIGTTFRIATSKS